MNLFKCILISCVIGVAGCKTKDKGLEERVEALEEKVSTEKATAPVNENVVSSETQGPFGEMSFKEKTHDFGIVTEGKKVKHTFYFENTGKASLVIQNASASCGCTVPDWPKEPIEPGKEGKIDVEFDTHGKLGPQNKIVSITANTSPQITTVNIVADVRASETNSK